MSDMNAGQGALRTHGQKLKDDLGRVGESVGMVKEELSGMGRDAVDASKAGVATAREGVSRGVDKAKDYGDDAVESLTEHVRNRPLASLGIAVGVGVVLGMMMCRSRN